MGATGRTLGTKLDGLDVLRERDQFRQRRRELSREAKQHPIGRVQLAALDRADVVPVEGRAEAEFLLREAALCAGQTDGPAERTMAVKRLTGLIVAPSGRMGTGARNRPESSAIRGLQGP